MPRGGARPGAGRKKKAKAAETVTAYTAQGVKTADAPPEWPFGTEPTAPADTSKLLPLDYLLSVVRDVSEDRRIRIQAASIAAPYLHEKPGEAGKKGKQQEAAKTASAGKFAAAAAPLKLVKRGP